MTCDCNQVNCKTHCLRILYPLAHRKRVLLFHWENCDNLRFAAASHMTRQRAARDEFYFVCLR